MEKFEDDIKKFISLVVDPTLSNDEIRDSTLNFRNEYLGRDVTAMVVSFADTQPDPEATTSDPPLTSVPPSPCPDKPPQRDESAMDESESEAGSEENMALATIQTKQKRRRKTKAELKEKRKIRDQDDLQEMIKLKKVLDASYINNHPEKYPIVGMHTSEDILIKNLRILEKREKVCDNEMINISYQKGKIIHFLRLRLKGKEELIEYLKKKGIIYEKTHIYRLDNLYSLLEKNPKLFKTNLSFHYIAEKMRLLNKMSELKKI